LAQQGDGLLGNIEPLRVGNLLDGPLELILVHAIVDPGLILSE